MMKLFIIDLPAQCSSGRLKTISEKAISAACRKRNDIEAEYITAVDEFCLLAGKGSLRKAKILFIAEIDEGGINLEACKILSYLQSHASSKPLTGSAGAIVIDGRGDMFTKDLGRRIAFAANIAGLSSRENLSWKPQKISIISGYWQICGIRIYTAPTKKVFCF